MRTDTWLRTHTGSLAGRRVAITGPTGGLGRELCRYMAMLGAELILLGRNEAAMQTLQQELEQAYPGVITRRMRLDLENMDEVRAVCETLEAKPPDILFLSAGAYSIPRHACTAGFDNVFQINFVSHNYLLRRLAPLMAEKPGARVVAVGSIAHRYSHTDPEDVDFSTRQSAALVYGNSKRYLMASAWGYAANHPDIALSVVHPGITFTNITAHYPKWLFAIIKHLMKWIFMSPRRACLSLVQGVFEETGSRQWIGPRLWDIWGLPQRCCLRAFPEEECRRIEQTAEQIYQQQRKAEMASKSTSG